VNRSKLWLQAATDSWKRMMIRSQQRTRVLGVARSSRDAHRRYGIQAMCRAPGFHRL
jgi:hypothetical protein